MIAKNLAYFDDLAATERRCLEHCLEAHQACEATIQHCLRAGGPHADPDHIRILQDCSDISATAANFLLRGSELHEFTCDACAEICLICADECETLGAEDAAMLDCAQACRRCADSCRGMVEHVRAA